MSESEAFFRQYLTGMARLAALSLQEQQRTNALLEELLRATGTGKGVAVRAKSRGQLGAVDVDVSRVLGSIFPGLFGP